MAYLETTRTVNAANPRLGTSLVTDDVVTALSPPLAADSETRLYDVA